MNSRLRLLFVAAGLVAALGCQSERGTSTEVESTTAATITPAATETETTEPADASEPSAESAVRDLQAFLNLRTGRWTVNEITPLGTSQGTVEGRQSYQMVGMVDLTVESDGAPRPSDLESDPWLSKISRSKGERKSPQLTLTWLKTDEGWKLRDIE